VSEQSQGPGWWQASDGRWYPPQSQPAAPPPQQAWRPTSTAPVDHPQGTTILILGILSLVVCGLLGPVAWIMGNNALAEIDRTPTAYANRGNVQAGRICGIIATVLLALVVVFIIIVMAAAAGSST